MNALVRLRQMAETPGGSRVVVARADLLAVLALVAPDLTHPDATGAVTLTEADADQLAAASWATATTTRVARYGDWPDAPAGHRRDTVDAARRTLHLLITGDVLPEPTVEGAAC